MTSQVFALTIERDGMGRFNGDIIRVSAVGRGSTSVVFKAFDLSNNRCANLLSHRGLTRCERFVAVKEATSVSKRTQAGTEDSGTPLVVYEAKILVQLARCAANTIVE